MDIRELAQDEWPIGLSQIPHPPKQLWIRGTLPSTDSRLLAVVGSRALSRYGQEATDNLISGLAGYPISIISGLALGADAAAHRAALSAGLHTIAIPGSGLDDSVIGPRTNLGLAHDILKSGGALISENPPLHKPWLKEFPSRNRIMVGMSHAVLMIEAGNKSGTLITAKLAGDYSRDLLTIPHRIGDPHSFGPHLFARMGAALITEPLHILEALKIPPKENGATAAPIDLDSLELTLWKQLEEPKSRDELLRTVKAPAGEILTALVALELRGLIREEFSAWHRM